MRFAEVFLRLGCSLSGWLVAYAHCLWLSVLPQAACGGAGPDPWFATLFLAAPAVAFALMIPVGRRLPGVGHSLRWLSLPLLLLVPLAGRSVASGFQRASVAGVSLCASLGEAGAAPATWESFWPPAQLLALVVISASAASCWRSLSTADAAGK